MRAGNNSAERQSKARRLRRKASFLAPPPDAVDTTTFYRMVGRNLPIALALATFINSAGRCDPGQRAIAERAREISRLEGSSPSGKRDGFSAGRINAKLAELVDAGMITQQHRGPTETCSYQVTARFLPVFLELRLRFCRDFGSRFWRRSRASACFIDETKGYSPDKKLIPTEASQTPDAARAEENQPVSASPADAAPATPEASISDDDLFEALADIEVCDDPAQTSERSSDAPLLPEEAAASPEPHFRPIERQRLPPNCVARHVKPRQPDAFTPKRLLQEKLGRFVLDRHGVATWLDFLEQMERGGRDAQRLFDRLDSVMRASGWEDRG